MATTARERLGDRTLLRTSALLLSGFMLLSSRHAFAQQSSGTQHLPALELQLSDDTLQLRYMTSGEVVNVDRGELSASFFLSEDRDVVGTVGLLVPADVDLGPLSGRLSIEFGPRAYAALLEEKNNDVLSLALGARIRFDIAREQELAVVGDAFYAPDILTFGSADKLTDLGARVEMRIAPRLVGFAGMRWFELDLLEGEERTLQEELIAGVVWRFK